MANERRPPEGCTCGYADRGGCPKHGMREFKWWKDPEGCTCGYADRPGCPVHGTEGTR